VFEMRTTLVSGGGISTLQPEADPTYRLESSRPSFNLLAGKILPDDKTVADANFKEKDVRVPGGSCLRAS
jgi:hypothetical protein